jgi:dTDP-glucose 4,6-dehydratase
MNRQNVLVTGGAGFIGSNFIRYLLGAEPAVRVINLDALTYAGSLQNLEDQPESSARRHTFVQGDIGDRELVDKLLRENAIDTIVHFAAETHVDRSILGPELFIRTNVA